MPRQMHLMAYLKTGPSAMHSGGWRHPLAPLHDIFSPSRYAHIARVLEDARFDGCFYADTQGIPDIYEGSPRAYLQHGGQLSYLDPMTILPIMAQATQHLGLGATLSTSFHHPYHLARTLASLDMLSGGRACWNIVTSSTDFEARNFGMEELADKESRYDRGDEVVEACCALWDCWDQDALIMDKARGLFIDPRKVQYANYRGEHVSTRGPLSVPPSPQRRPVLMQAGSSPRGREFAARWAEAIFFSPADKPSAIALYDDIKSRMVLRGRAPEDCAMLAWISVVLGETDAIAHETARASRFACQPGAGDCDELGDDRRRSEPGARGRRFGGGEKIAGSSGIGRSAAPDDEDTGHQLRGSQAAAKDSAMRHAGDGRRFHAGHVRVRRLRRLHSRANDLSRHVRGIWTHGGA